MKDSTYYSPTPSYCKIAPQKDVYQSRPTSSFSEASSSYVSSASPSMLGTDDEEGCHNTKPTRHLLPPRFSGSSGSQSGPKCPPWLQEQLPHYSRLLHGPPVEPGMLAREVPKWRRYLDAATSFQGQADNSHHSTIDDWAFSLASAVMSSPNPHLTILEMVKCFLWKAIDPAHPPFNPQLNVVARLAERLVDFFSDDPGNAYRTSYRHIVAEIFVGTFISAWDSGRNPESITYHPKPTECIVQAAFRLGYFIIKLWERGLVCDGDLQDCFTVLTTTFKSHEHAQTLHMLLVHAGPKPWSLFKDGPAKLLELGKFMDGMHYRIRGSSSVVGKSRSDEDVEKLLKSIAWTCREWVETHHRQAFQSQGMYRYRAGRPPGL